MDINLNGGNENVFECGTSCFLDLDTSVRPAPQFSRELARPWKEFWPPSIESDVYEWLSLTCPEALSWRFDSSRPFHRPWRAWTRSAAAKREQAIFREEQRSMNAHTLSE